ncbi:MAG: polysaccharide deacetylase family protein [Chitinivibrionales bacterium]|nr:polysaccharide deacetylase family protein [Chitinivibrionales bacterium]
MARHNKKHKPHHCIHHPQHIARGRCVRCHAWICAQCGRFSNGRFACVAACAVAPQETKDPAIVLTAPHYFTEPENVIPGRKPGRKWPHVSLVSILLPAAALLGLAGLIFGLWTARENKQLRAENRTLQEHRMQLIDHIKNANEETSKLQERLASASVNTNRPPQKAPPSQNTPLAVNIDLTGSGPAGLPLSFANGTTARRLVALTFDGGSFDNAAAAILDTLKARQITVTIFASGEFINRYPELIRRMLAEGHEIGNHTEHHPHLTDYESSHIQRTLPGVARDFLCRELAQANATFFRLTGRQLMPLWRAPYGEINGRIASWAQECGYIHIGWRQGRSWRQNLDSNDWIADENEKGYHSPQEVLQKILSVAHAAPDGINGGIILMHLGTERKDQSKQVHRILGQLIDSLSALDYSIVPVSQLLRESGVTIASLPARDSSGLKAPAP